tara:strand:- start:8171 stop:10057 length:1887 start_codon:yes stop_codon:yes gene_type:complete
VALLLLAALLVYWPGLGGGFLFDDYPNLLASESWKLSSLEPARLLVAWQSDISGAIGRPLALLSFATNHVFTGLDPRSLKLTNLVMHLANGALVYLVCRLLLSMTQGPLRDDRKVIAAALVAGAWLLHPLQASTVLYVVQRMEIGAATGTLACVALYLLARRRQLAGRTHQPLFALSAGALLLGLGFKESALVAPLLLLAIEVAILGFKGRSGKAQGLLWAHAAWLTPALLAYLFWVVPGATSAEAYAHRDYNAGQRLLSQSGILLMYLKQILVPLPDSMLFYYDHIRAPEGIFSAWYVLAAPIGILALIAAAVAARKRWPLASLGMLWFFACHALTSNVIPLELAFEHRNYLALLGPLLVICDAGMRLTQRLHGDAALSIGFVPLLALAGLCLIQSSTWGDPFRLAAALAGRNPDSPRANYALGVALHQASRGDRDSPQWSLAVRQFEAAAQLPGASALPDQALVIMAAGEDAEISRRRWERLEGKLLQSPLGPENVSALHSVVSCQLESRCDLPDAAVFDLLMRMQDKHPDAYVLAIIRANFAWNGLGEQEAAISILREWQSRGASPYQVDLALAEFLLASNLHANQEEASRILAALMVRDLSPEARGKVRELRARQEGTSVKPES